MVDQKPGARTPRSAPQQGSTRAAVVRRRRLLLLGGLVVVVLIAALTAFVWPGFARTPEPLPEVTVTAPPPSPTAEAADLPQGSTDLQSSLPDSVLQLVRLEVAENTGWVDDSGAVESWIVTYGDGSEGGAQVDLVVGQWADADDAAEVHAVLLDAAGEQTLNGDVTVGGETVGTYAVTPGAVAGTSVVTWRNDTVVFQATGPDQLVQDFYQSFPM